MEIIVNDTIGSKDIKVFSMDDKQNLSLVNDTFVLTKIKDYLQVSINVLNKWIEE